MTMFNGLHFTGINLYSNFEVNDKGYIYRDKHEGIWEKSFAVHEKICLSERGGFLLDRNHWDSIDESGSDPIVIEDSPWFTNFGILKILKVFRTI